MRTWIIVIMLAMPGLAEATDEARCTELEEACENACHNLPEPRSEEAVVACLTSCSEKVDQCRTPP